MEERLKNAYRDLQMANEKYDLQVAQHDIIYARYNEIRAEGERNTEEYKKAMHENRRLKQEQAKMIPKDQSERIAKENKTISREL